MIKNLSGEYETVEYENKRFVMLYDNVETEYYPTHWHTAVEIIMPLENNFTVLTGDKQFDLHERDVIIIPPGELHTLPEYPGRRIIFQCSQDVLNGNPALEAIMPLFNSTFVITPELDRELSLRAQRCMLNIYTHYYEESAISDVRIYADLIDLLVAVREQQLHQAMHTMSADKDKMLQYNEKFQQVLKYIDQNYMYEISLDTLADIAGYSKFHFSRLFKQYNAMSYLQYINIRRTRAAEALLLDPTIPITEVAMRAGFTSLSTFNRIFKEIKHCTPSNFQRMYRSTGDVPPPEHAPAQRPAPRT